jgi:hypothetical protein
MEGNGRRRFRRGTVRAIPPELHRSPGEQVAHSVLGFDKVWFTSHALQRMKQRGISQAEVFSVLEHPTRKGLKTQPNRERWRRNRMRGLAVDVVFERWTDRLCIVTVIAIQVPL